MPKPNVAVVSPIYRPQPSPIEDISLRRRGEILGDYKSFWIAPDTLDTTPYDKYGDVETLSFSPGHFLDNKTYSRLLLREDFYAAFAAYDYVLIYQTDAFVFRDALEEFCSTGDHYFGAPFPQGYAWPNYSFRGVSHVLNRFPFLLPRRKAYVGNGGFSLRHVGATRELLQKDGFASRTYRGHEDIYFATRIFTKWKDAYKICDLDTAYRFALDQEPGEGLKRLGGKLPFGCHAWEKFEPEVWRPIFASLGYEF